jgi:hypothetical protein
MTCLHRHITHGLEALATTRLFRIVAMEDKGYQRLEPSINPQILFFFQNLPILSPDDLLLK